MDKIDCFVIHAQIKRNLNNLLNFVLLEEDIPEKDRENFRIIEYIDNFTRKLNKEIPQIRFTWSEAHKIEPDDIYSEIIHQLLVRG